jgi:hypothetical protein
MSVLIDLIGSAIVAGYVLMLGLGINTNISSTAVASTTTVTVQEFVILAASVFEADLKKMGYGLVDPTTGIAVADSNRIRFRADMNRNGSIDSVEWYVGPLITKPNGLLVRNLYRKYNNGTPQIVAANVKTFSLRYLDQDGGATSTLSNIAVVETTIEISSPYMVADQVKPEDQQYITTIWRQGRVVARNIRRHG